jgi:hypothetical protein
MFVCVAFPVDGNQRGPAIDMFVLQPDLAVPKIVSWDSVLGSKDSEVAGEKTLKQIHEVVQRID